jgi:cobalamin biosynthesis Mg chelatase CobN
MASASNPAPAKAATNGTSNKTQTVVDDGIDSLLNRQALAVQKEAEIDRILKAFKLKYVIPFLQGKTIDADV